MMYVDLPDTGCNILNSSSVLYNYSTDLRRRDTYTIYEGQIFLQSTSTSNVGYSVSGTCLSDGDIAYRPVDFQVWFPLSSFALFFVIIWLVYRVFLRRLLP